MSAPVPQTHDPALWHVWRIIESLIAHILRLVSVLRLAFSYCPMH